MDGMKKLSPSHYRPIIGLL